MKIAIIGPNVDENSIVVKEIIHALQRQGIDIPNLRIHNKEVYIETVDSESELRLKKLLEESIPDLIFELKNDFEEMRVPLEADEKFQKTKDITYSTKFKDNRSVNYENRNSRNRK